ncbi:CAAX prenyl protease 1 homolog [Condylostylus longicornis]|uniref:CAAX prenyl protease 1 homolog n=1 Tax=Condylostylus longicornis TaxID=2530218 RepID=UPI00244DEFD6|nr:CAAX prenyl protease 1 homolog [Condylostylus longicornis]
MEYDIITYTLIIILFLENLWENYLVFRQIKVFRKSTKVPNELKDVMKDETFDKARIYGLDKECFQLFRSIILDLIILTIEIYFGFIAYLWQKSKDYTALMGLSSDNEIHVSCTFIIVTNFLTIIKEMPFKLYKTFSLEERHGFNKQTLKFFIWDQIKAFIIGQVIFIPIAAAIVFIVKLGGPYFFLWLWIFTGIVVFLLLTIYPSVIAPLFDKYRPLDDGPLREAIEKLAASLKFPLTKIYVVEGSKRSAHSNAYFYGLFGSKRIVLFDTLLINKGMKDDSELKEDEKGRGCTDDEVLAVLAHELGHWKLGHVTKNIVVMQIHLLLMFAAFQYLFEYDEFYQAVGFPKGERPVLVGLLLILSYVLGAYNAIISFAMTVLSRRFEYQADDFANQLGFSDELGGALIKLNIDNLGFPVYDWMYSAWNHSHPTLLQRLNRLKENKKEKKSN